MLLAEMGVKPEMAGRHTQRVRRVVAEVIPLLSLLVFLLLSALSASILPTSELLWLIAFGSSGSGGTAVALVHPRAFTHADCLAGNAGVQSRPLSLTAPQRGVSSPPGTSRASATPIPSFLQ